MDVCIELIILKAIGRAKRDLEFLCGKKIQDFTFFFSPHPTENKQKPLEFPLLCNKNQNCLWSCTSFSLNLWKNNLLSLKIETEVGKLPEIFNFGIFLSQEIDSKVCNCSIPRNEDETAGC